MRVCKDIFKKREKNQNLKTINWVLHYMNAFSNSPCKVNDSGCHVSSVSASLGVEFLF